jgi:uncharacterized protein
MKIGLISDTHSYLDDRVIGYLNGSDEIWHAGDIGTTAVLDALNEIAPVRAVYGNIDNKEIKMDAHLDQIFTIEKMKVWMTHIGGYPGRYEMRVREQISRVRPDIFISGHSHILKVVRDENIGLLHINPGSCGIYGMHKFRTLIKMEILNGMITDLKVIELGARGKIYCEPQT